MLNHGLKRLDRSGLMLPRGFVPPRHSSFRYLYLFKNDAADFLGALRHGYDGRAIGPIGLSMGSV